MKHQQPKNMERSFVFLITLLSFVIAFPTRVHTLHTRSRWVVDDTNQRVKLACANWASHLEPMTPEGLSKQPVDNISKKIAAMGFNCVRLTWPTYLVTNDTLASRTVRQSFEGLGMPESIAAIQANNPTIINSTLIDAFKAVVSSLADHKVMVILDNHVSSPGWCCNETDGNGFFKDRNFDPDTWLTGLTRMATLFKGAHNVVGMSLRNELRGSNMSVTDWYKYMEKGAEAVHAANPDVLVILSGLSDRLKYNTVLSFLRQKMVNLTFTGKLMFEVHSYQWYDSWGLNNSTQECTLVTDTFMQQSGFLLLDGYPLFLSEFGIDQRGTNPIPTRFINCLFGLLADLDLEWAIWCLMGSYSYRQGVFGMEEFFGMLDYNWSEIRNASFARSLNALQAPFQGPAGIQHKEIFHPPSGSCLQRFSGTYRLGSCQMAEAFTYTSQKTLTTLDRPNLCLLACGAGQPVTLSSDCNNSGAKWNPIPNSSMQFTATANDGKQVCLDVDPQGVLITNTCICLNTDSPCDPSTQWFKIVNSTRQTPTGAQTKQSVASLKPLDVNLINGEG